MIGSWLDTLGKLFDSPRFQTGSALASSALGTYGLISSALEANRLKKQQQRMIDISNAPLEVNVNPYAQAYAKAYADKYEREMQATGIPVKAGQYPADLLARAEAGVMADFYKQAVQDALAKRQGTLAGMGYAGQMSVPRPSFGADPFKALSTLAEQRRLERARQDVERANTPQLRADLSGLGPKATGFGISGLEMPGFPLTEEEDTMEDISIPYGYRR